MASFRYRLEYATRSQLVTPKDPVKIVVSREQEEVFFREKLTGSVTLTNEDYQFLRDAETYAVECCQEITFIIERSCAEEIFWEGYFTLYNVEWDHDNQEATIQKITVRDQYSVVFANWHKEINWFGDIPPHRPGAYYVPEHPLKPFTQPTVTSEYNPTGSDIYYRGFYFNYAILWLIQQTLKGTQAESYADITEQQMSDFLTLPTNPANGKPNYLRDVLLMHISDAKRPNSTEPASIGKVTLRDVLSNLKLLYNAWWYIDENGHFRIEHISYFKNFSYSPVGVTLDLVQEQEENSEIIIKKKYSYSADELKGREGVEQSLTLSAFDQKSEIWTNFANPSTREFSAAYMNYSDSCVPRDEKGAAAEDYRPISLFTTDWRTVSYKPDTVPDQGWVLVNVVNFTAESGIELGWVPIENEYYTNGRLAMTRLFYEFGRTDLSFAYGMMTFEKQTKPGEPNPESNYVTERPMRAKSTKRIKLFESIELPVCCGSDYDFTGIIKHPLDDETYMDRLEFNLDTETVNLTVIAVNNCENIPFPEYVEIEEPNQECPEQGRLIRSELSQEYTQHTAINYVYIYVYTDYYADGECGEYYQTRTERKVIPKRGNGPR